MLHFKGQVVLSSGGPRGEGRLAGRNPLLKPNPCFKNEESKLCKCSTCCYFKTAVTEFAPHHTEAKSAGWCSGKRHVISAGMGGSRGDAPSPPAIFKHVF